MKHKFGKLFNTLALALVMTLVAPWTAFADELIVDGDGLTTIGDSALNLGNVNRGNTASGEVNLVMKRTEGGANIFKNGTSPVVTATAPQGIGVAVSDNKIAIPSSWSSLPQNAGITTDDTATATVTVSAVNATCGAKTATVTFTATGINNNQNNNTLTRSKALTVNWTVVSCQQPTTIDNILASASRFGGTTDLSAKVAPAGASGSVNFYVNGSSTAVAASYNPSTGVASVNNYWHQLDASTTAYSVRAVFTSSSDGFGSSEATNSSALLVDKATPIVNAIGGTFTYSGNAQPGSWSATGVGGATLSPVTLSYKQGQTNLLSAPVDAGTYAVIASFAGNNNYLPGSSEATITINQAAQRIEWSNPAAITYGTVLGATQLNATLSTGDGALTYTPPTGTVLNAGTRTLHVDAAQTSNYNAAFAEVQIVVNKASPIITWNNPANITYGTALGNAQLNASADVPGIFEYSVAAGTVLNAGTHTLSVSFTPNDKDNYNTASTQVEIVVNKADQVISWSNPAAITYGTLLSGAQLNAALITGDGDLTYDRTIGALLNAGTHTLRVDAAATDNYNAAFKDVQLTINKAQATVSVEGGTYTYDGTVKAATGTILGVLNELLGTPSFTYNGSASSPVNAGTYNVVGSFAGNINYEPASSGGAQIVINKAQATVTLVNLSQVYSGQAKEASAITDATGTSSFTFAYTQNGEAATPVNAGSYAVVATLVNINYYGSATGALIINKADQVISWPTPTAIVYGAALSLAQLNATTNGDGALTYNHAIGEVLNAGTYTLQVDAAATANYNAAFKTVQLTVNKAGQTITFIGPSDKTLADKTITLNATAGPGLTVSFASTSTIVCSVSGSTVNILSVGKCTIVASQAGNSNYEAATSVSKSFYVTYGSAYSGLLAPINTTGNRSSFKLGSTIPVKFKLTADGMPIANTVNKLVVTKVDNVPDNVVNEVLYSDTATTGNTFRWTGAPDNQYIFNLSTKNVYTNPNGSQETFSPGTWRLNIQLSDGTTQTQLIDIQK